MKNKSQIARLINKTQICDRDCDCAGAGVCRGEWDAKIVREAGSATALDAIDSHTQTHRHWQRDWEHFLSSYCYGYYTIRLERRVTYYWLSWLIAQLAQQLAKSSLPGSQSGCSRSSASWIKEMDKRATCSRVRIYIASFCCPGQAGCQPGPVSSLARG